MNDNKAGCLGIIFALSFVFGNIFLFTGGVNEYGDNWIIILMIAVAVITDIALIYYFINSRINIIKSRIGKNKNNSKQGELDELIHDFNELEINNDFKNEESDNAKEFIENIIENETELNEDKSNETIEEVKRIRQLFSPSINNYTLKECETFEIDRKYVNNEITNTVHNLKDCISNILNKCCSVDEAINRILECKECQNIDDILIYLKSRIKDLQMLKEKSNLYHSDLKRILKKK